MTDKLQKYEAKKAKPRWLMNERTSQLLSFVGDLHLHFGALADRKPFSASCHVDGVYILSEGRSVGEALKKLDARIRRHLEFPT